MKVNITRNIMMRKITKIVFFSLVFLSSILKGVSQTQTTVEIFPTEDAILEKCDDHTNPIISSWSSTNNGNSASFTSVEWTKDGKPYQAKALIKWDMSCIPVDAVITTVHLSLYAYDPTGTAAAERHANTVIMGNSGYKPNSSVLRRITTNWNESTVTWNSFGNDNESTSTTNQVILESSTTVDQDYLNIDITNLVKDMIQYENNGLYFCLENPQLYSSMSFCSSDHDTPSLHPKVVITYTSSVYLDQITSHLSDQLAYTDDPVSFSVTALGAGLTYQWRKNGNDILEATAPTYSISSVSTDDAGTYDCRVTGGCKSEISNSATLTVSIDEGLVPDAIEYQALVDLYDDTDGLNWTNELANNQKWKEGTTIQDIGTWFGITLDATGKDVMSINLNYNELNGTLPTSLGNLIALTDLTLIFNQLSGSIPSELGLLGNLTDLVLGENQLSGTLPYQLGQLSNLLLLNVYGNQLSGDIPVEIGQLSSLTSCFLNNNSFTSLPDFVNKMNLNLNTPSNNLDFTDLEQYFTGVGIHTLNTFTYSPQAIIGEVQTIDLNSGEQLELTVPTGGDRTNYQWQKKDQSEVWQNVVGADNATYNVESSRPDDAGEYKCIITNDWVTGLTLESNIQTVVVNPFTWEVTNTDDDPAVTGSLPWAVVMVNSEYVGSEHNIHFNIPGTGPHEIKLKSKTPITYDLGIQRKVHIDGTTQPGYSGGTPYIIIKGIAADGTDGIRNGNNECFSLSSTSEGSIIEGIELYNYSTGIDVSSNNNIFSNNIFHTLYYGIWLENSQNNQILNNIFGTNFSLDPDIGMEDCGIRVCGDNNLLKENTLINGQQFGIRIDCYTGNTLTQNIIYDNGFGAIINSANNYIDKPIVSSAQDISGTITIVGTSVPNAKIELFESNGAQNAIRFVETSVDIISDGIGNWTVDIASEEGIMFVATQTDVNGNTSELSDPITVELDCPVDGGGYFYVTNSDNTGEGSLRAAIDASNASITDLPHHIEFCDIGVPYDITLVTQLPDITQTVEIDASTLGTPVQVEGNSNISYALYIAAANTKLNNLLFDNFTSNGGDGIIVYNADNVEIVNCILSDIGSACAGTGIRLTNSNNSIIQGCKIGTDISGMTEVASNMSIGISLSECTGISIGGTGVNEGNVISGNGDCSSSEMSVNSIRISNSQNIDIYNNKIGVAIDGLTKIPNLNGIYLSESSNINLGQAGAGNIICVEGMAVFSWSNDISEFSIKGNEFIKSGGSEFATAIDLGISQNINIGGIISGERNIFRDFATVISIPDYSGSLYSHGINIRQNEMHNTTKGIQITNPEAPIKWKAPPIIQMASSISNTVSGTINTLLTASENGNIGDIVELFISDADGEDAFQFIDDDVVDAEGKWSIDISGVTFPDPANPYVIATITQALGSNGSYIENTSEFSSSIFVSDCPILSITITPTNGPLYKDGCGGYTNGPVTLIAGAGAGIFTYQWFKDNEPFGEYNAGTDEGLGTNQALDVVEAGEYFVQVTDENGCTGIESYTVTAQSNPLLAGYYFVNSSLDVIDPNDGVTTLREAIEASNASTTDLPHHIKFCEDNQPYNITLASPLSEISQTVEIDAIYLDNHVQMSDHGLKIIANSSIVRGIDVNNVQGVAGIEVNGANDVFIDFCNLISNQYEGVLIDNSTGSMVMNCEIIGNDQGVIIRNSSNIDIGAEGRGRSGLNIILSNITAGIIVEQNSSNIDIFNNNIGLDATGLIAQPNGVGISISESEYVNIGIIKPNYISGNSGNGISILDNSEWVFVENNYIGADINGSFVPNNNHGIFISTNVKNVKIGGSEVNNIIVSSGASNTNGIAIASLDDLIARTQYVNITQNLFLNNGSEAIKYINSPTLFTFKQAPLILSANAEEGTVSGEVLSETCNPEDLVELYKSDINGRDALEYIGSTVVLEGGIWTATNLALNPNEANYIIATITDAPGSNNSNLENTSEFSSLYIWDDCSLASPSISANEAVFNLSECSGDYINAPITLTLGGEWSSQIWFIEDNINGDLNEIGTNDIQHISQQGTYHVKAFNSVGCAAKAQINIGEVLIPSDDPTNLICNGDFENSINNGDPSNLCENPETVICYAGSDFEQCNPEMNVYGFEFDTDNKYAYEWDDYVTSVFVVSDQISGPITGLVSCQFSAGSRGNALIIAGYDSYNQCNATNGIDWKQNIQLTPNTLYEFSFEITRIGEVAYDDGAYCPVIDLGLKVGETVHSLYSLGQVILESPDGTSEAITSPWTIIENQYNEDRAWYVIKCLFNSGNISNAEILIDNLGDNQAVWNNMIALDNIELRETPPCDIETSPSISANQPEFRLSECSGDYINGPIILSLNQDWVGPIWFDDVNGNKDGLPNDNEILRYDDYLRINEPGTYHVKVYNDEGCSDITQITIGESTIPNDDPANLICNGDFENPIFNGDPEGLCENPETVICGESFEIEQCTPDMNQYGFEFETGNNYSYNWNSFATNLFMIADKLYNHPYENYDIRSSGNSLITAGYSAINTCDAAEGIDWKQNVQLNPNTFYEFTFEVTRVGPGRGYTGCPVIDVGLQVGETYQSFYTLGEVTVESFDGTIETTTAPWPILEVVNGDDWGWYIVKCTFNSGNITDAEVFINNIADGESSENNIIALDNIRLIAPDNELSILTLIPNNTTYDIATGEKIIIDIEATDTDAGDILTLSCIEAETHGAYFTTDPPANGSVSGNFDWIPTILGTYTFTFAVTDDNERKVEQVVTINVGDGKPIITGVTEGEIIDILIGEAYNLDITALDYNTEQQVALTLVGSAIDSHGAIYTVGVEANPIPANLTWTPDGTMVGAHVMTATAISDESDEDKTILTFTLNVVDPAPVFAGINTSTYNVKFGSPLEIEFTVSDANINDIISVATSRGEIEFYEASTQSNPKNPVSAKLIWTSSVITDLGDQQITLTATDFAGNTTNQIINLLVEDAEPVITGLESHYVIGATVYTEISFVIFDNSINEVLIIDKFGTVLSEGGAVFTETETVSGDQSSYNCTLIWTPGFVHKTTDTDPYTFSVIAEDNAGHVVESEVTIDVTDAPPILELETEIQDYYLTANEIELVFHATDATVLDVIAISGTGIPFDDFGAEIDQGTDFDNDVYASFIWTPSHSSVGEYDITITATDAGGLTDVEVIHLVITDVPRSMYTYESECTSDNVDFVAAESKGTVNYLWDFGDGKEQEGINLFTVTNEYDEPGEYQVTLTTSLGELTSTSIKNVVVGSPEAYFFAEDVCKGNLFTPQNVTLGGNGYKWTVTDENDQEIFISYQMQPSFMLPNAEKYNIMLDLQLGGCTSSYSQEITVSEGVEAKIGSITKACTGTEIYFDGSNSLNAKKYSWNFNDPTADQNANTSRRESPSYIYDTDGQYEVILEVSNGKCKDLASWFVEVAPAPKPVIKAETDYFCEGNSVELEAGIEEAYGANYTYEWKNQAGSVIGTSKYINVYEGGDYTLSINNECGDSEDPALITVTKSLAPSFELELISGINCPGARNGEVNVVLDNNSDERPYTIKWGENTEELTEETTYSISGLASGTTYVNITNNSACESNQYIDVPDEGPQISVETVPTSCIDETGEITATIIGGSAGEYDFQWYNEDGNLIGSRTDQTVTNLSAGTYSLIVISPESCELTKSNIRITQPVVHAEVENTNACGNDEIIVEVVPSISGSINPTREIAYYYSWSNGLTTKTASLFPDVNPYYVTITDDYYNCSKDISFTVNESAPITAEVKVTNNLCFGEALGKVQVSASGAEGEYEYLWSDETAANTWETPEVRDLPAGMYYVTVTDERGCSATADGKVLDPEELLLEMNEISTPCAAEAYLSVLNCDPSDPEQDCSVSEEDVYEFSWIRLEGNEPDRTEHTERTTTTYIAVGLPQGTYTVIVTDKEGCVTYTDDETEVEGRETAPDFTYHIAYEKPDIEEEPEEEEEPEIFIETVLDMQEDLNTAVNECEMQMQDKITMNFESTCLNINNFDDKLNLIYDLPYYQYTLYYYDRAGNLTKTVPPEGVEVLAQADIENIMNYRINNGGSTVLPEHKFTTTYEYNNLKQLESQNTPDANNSEFIYDGLNRLRFSQNARQLSAGTFSYTKYDELSRIIEVGESVLTESFSNLDVNDPLCPTENNKAITRTIYTDNAIGINYYGKTQTYLNNRVSYTYSDQDGNDQTPTDRVYTYYSYDPHGNVEWLVQDLPGFSKNYIRYEYDLISGNVLKVVFNEYRSDKFFHRYDYDEDNRILSVETSTDGVIWDMDAKYDYYAHGPLRNVILGDDQVQKVDYYYTLHGWLKAINNPIAEDNPEFNTGEYNTDAFAMSLGYYKGDFYHEGSNLNTYNSNFNDEEKDLYNGNISSWVNFTNTDDINQFNQYAGQTTANLYTYDKLNRLKASVFEYQDAGVWSGTSGDYSTEFSYDRNGNIQTLKRNSFNNLGESRMDDLEYEYDYEIEDENGNNQLKFITENYTGTSNGTLGDVYSGIGYVYDDIGNLTKETGQVWDETNLATDYQTDITWNVYGKVNTVSRKQFIGDDTKETFMEFLYDAAGNRIMKKVKTNIQPVDDPVNERTTFYVRDASGNVMGTYVRENILDGENYTAEFRMLEQPVYGSDRIGLREGDISEDPLHSQELTNGNEIVNFDVNELSGNAGYKNWISPALKIIDIGTDTLCDCKIQQLNFPNGTFNNVIDQDKTVEFMGYARNNVCIAEDINQNLLFYSIVPESYFGNENRCLIFDNQGKLMEGSHGIEADSRGKPMVMRKQGASGEYYLITIGTDKRPYYHVVDMKQNGYGDNNSAGKVILKNQLIDASEEYAYGYHMVVVEDNMSESNILYMTRYIPSETPDEMGITQILAFDFGKSGENPQAEILAEVVSMDLSGEGELQISPYGKKLAWYNRKRSIAGFAHQEVEINIFELDNSRKTVINTFEPIPGNKSGTYGKSSVEFASEDNLYFNQRGLFELESGTGEKSTWAMDSKTSLIDMVNTPSFGELRRGFDGKLYLVPEQEVNNWMVLSGITASPTALSYIPQAVDYGFSGNLPAQTYKIKGNNTGLFTRKVGLKRYELKDHLGNVRAVVTDQHSATFNASNELQTTATIESATNYYPFGMQMPGMFFTNNTVDKGGYRYGFNGKEKDDEWTGTSGATYDYGFRIYDARIARLLSVDPYDLKFPSLSAYQYASNRPIDGVDLLGLQYMPSSWSTIEQVYAAVDKKTADEIMSTQYKVSAVGLCVFGAVIAAPAVAAEGSFIASTSFKTLPLWQSFVSAFSVSLGARVSSAAADASGQFVYLSATNNWDFGKAFDKINWSSPIYTALAPTNYIFNGMSSNAMQYNLEEGIQFGSGSDIAIGALGEFLGGKVQVELNSKWLKQVKEQLNTFKTFQDKGLSDKILGKEAALYLLMKYGGEPVISVTAETLENAQNDYLKVLEQEKEDKNDTKQKGGQE